MSAPLEISVKDGVVIAEPIGVFENTDLAMLERVRNQLLAEATTASPPVLLFDLGRASYFGSPFVGLLFETWLKLRPRAGKMAFCNVSGDLKRVLGVVRLDTVCAFYPNRQAALAELSAVARAC